MSFVVRAQRFSLHLSLRRLCALLSLQSVAVMLAFQSMVRALCLACFGPWHDVARSGFLRYLFGVVAVKA